MNKRKDLHAKFRLPDPATAGRVRDQVRYKLTRINIYFIKEHRSHEMYRYTWNDPLIMSQVNLLLEEVMDILTIDPSAKSY